jgi:hypothetical protein
MGSCEQFVHDFHTKIGTVDNVSPSVDYTSFGNNDGLVEVWGKILNSSQIQSTHSTNKKETLLRKTY